MYRLGVQSCGPHLTKHATHHQGDLYKRVGHRLHRRPAIDIIRQAHEIGPLGEVRARVRDVERTGRRDGRFGPRAICGIEKALRIGGGRPGNHAIIGFEGRLALVNCARGGHLPCGLGRIGLCEVFSPGDAVPVGAVGEKSASNQCYLAWLAHESRANRRGPGWRLECGWTGNLSTLRPRVVGPVQAGCRRNAVPRLGRPALFR